MLEVSNIKGWHLTSWFSVISAHVSLRGEALTVTKLPEELMDLTQTFSSAVAKLHTLIVFFWDSKMNKIKQRWIFHSKIQRDSWGKSTLNCWYFCCYYDKFQINLAKHIIAIYDRKSKIVLKIVLLHSNQWAWQINRRGWDFRKSNNGLFRFG